MFAIPHIAQRHILRRPARFLESRAGQRWLDALAAEYPHEAFVASRSDAFSASDRNAYAARILEAKRRGLPPACLLYSDFRDDDGSFTWHDEVEPDLCAYLEANGRAHGATWACAVEDHWRERAALADTSTPLDLFSSHDSCEILFALTRTTDCEDNLIRSHKPWPDPAELAVDGNLQFALSRIGYSLSRFRKLSGNRHKSAARLAPLRTRRPPIIGYPGLASTIENACSAIFNFYLYAIVPLTDLIALDLAAPLTIAPCWLATMNPLHGTFHEEPCAAPVTVRPGDGHLLSAAEIAYSPDDICGLYRPHFHGRVFNAAPAE